MRNDEADGVFVEAADNNSLSILHIPFAKACLLRLPFFVESHSSLYTQISISHRRPFWWEKGTYHIALSVRFGNFEHDQMSRTTFPLSRGSSS